MSEEGQSWFLAERVFHYFVMAFISALIVFAVWYAYMSMQPRQETQIEGVGEEKALPGFIKMDETGLSKELKDLKK